MSFFWHNPKNEHLKEKKFRIHSEYSPLQWILLTLLWIVLLPFGAIVYVLGNILLGMMRISAQIAFASADRLLLKKKFTDPADNLQCIRSFLSNTIGSHLPHHNSALRRFLFRLGGVRIGRGSFIGMHGYMEDYRPENVVIEDNVTCSFEVTFIAHGAKRGKADNEKHIILRKGAYIGARSILLPGVEVGEQAVVGAGAVVTKDVPPGAVVAGNPARILRYKEGFDPTKTAKEGVEGGLSPVFQRLGKES